MSPAATSRDRQRQALLLASVFVVAVCGLVYELLAGALSTYLLGSSVTQFSLVIGLFMSAMGLGSFASRWVKRDALSVFVAVELVIGVVGGVSALLLFWSFAFLETFVPFLVVSTLTIGALVGLEIPLVIRILKERQALAHVISSVLALDYIGALAASLLFPLLLVPFLGLVRTGFLFGLMNVAVAALALWRLHGELRWRVPLKLATLVATVGLSVGLFTAGGLTELAEDALYQDEIVLTRDTPYQRIVVTRWKQDVRLYLNGHLQFSTVDEARYHESLVHPAMSSVPRPRRVLILGGGDGMAVREVLKYPSIEKVDLVDLDAEVTRLFSDHPLLVGLNGRALHDERVQVHNTDAGRFLEEARDSWDVILIDLPDPSTPTLARLYAESFYRLATRRLAQRGALATQATSPFFAPEAFGCILSTLESAIDTPLGLRRHAQPYHTNVPSFGTWGFILVTPTEVGREALRLTVPTRYLNDETLKAAFAFPADMTPKRGEVNRLNDPVLVRLYERAWINE